MYMYMYIYYPCFFIHAYLIAVCEAHPDDVVPDHAYLIAVCEAHPDDVVPDYAYLIAVCEAHPDDVVPDRSPSKIHVEISVAVLHTHQTILLNLKTDGERGREGVGERGRE